MCGIVGVAGAVGVSEEKLFKQLLIIDSIRGEHSTGIASVNTDSDGDSEYPIAKRAGDPFQLLETLDAVEIFRNQNRILIGHNRYATIGAVTRKNAHPFEFSNIVGVHNGTLTNKNSIPDGYKFDVDSEAMFNHINNVGVEEAMKGISGAWAMVFYDKKEKTLNFLRNKERPLFYAYSKDHKCVFWASESWMLTAVLARESYNFDTSGIYTFAEDKLYTFDIDVNNRSIGNMSPINKPKVRTVEGKPSAKVSYLTYPSKTTQKSGDVKEKKSSPSDKPAPKTDGFVPDYINKKGVVLELVAALKDEYSSKYILCTDPLNPDLDIRVYYHEGDEVSGKVGCFIKGDISSMRIKSTGTPLYKVSPWSIEFLDNSVFDAKDVFITTDYGEIVTREEFEKNFSECAWCSSPILYEETFFISGKDCFCSDCMKSEEVQQYIPKLKALMQEKE